MEERHLAQGRPSPGLSTFPQYPKVKAFRMDSRGWDEQMNNIEQFLKVSAKAREHQQE